jgi:hypothetical protein
LGSQEFFIIDIIISHEKIPPKWKIYAPNSDDFLQFYLYLSQTVKISTLKQEKTYTKSTWARLEFMQ